VFIIDQLGAQRVTDPVTGSEVGPEPDPNLTCVVTGCVWNSQFVPLTMRGEKEESAETMALEHFAQAIKLIPEGKTCGARLTRIGSLDNGRI
jgi:hypothetical protein